MCAGSAAGQRVLSLAADAHRAPSQWDIARAAEMEADESALREGAGSNTPMAQRLRQHTGTPHYNMISGVRSPRLE